MNLKHRLALAREMNKPSKADELNKQYEPKKVTNKPRYSNIPKFISLPKEESSTPKDIDESYFDDPIKLLKYLDGETINESPDILTDAAKKIVEIDDQLTNRFQAVKLQFDDPIKLIKYFDRKTIKKPPKSIRKFAPKNTIGPVRKASVDTIGIITPTKFITIEFPGTEIFKRQKYLILSKDNEAVICKEIDKYEFITIPLNHFMLNEWTFKIGNQTYTRRFSVNESQISELKEDVSILKDIAMEKQESIVLKNRQTYHLIFSKTDEFDEEIFEVEYDEGAKEQYAWSKTKKGYPIKITPNHFLLNEYTFKNGSKTYTRKFSFNESQISGLKEDISILKDIAVEKQESIVLKNGQTYHLIFSKTDEFDEEIFEVEYDEGAKEQYAWSETKKGYHIKIPLNHFLLNETTFKKGRKTYTREFSVNESQISGLKEDISILKDIAVEKQESMVLKNGQTYHLIFPKSDEYDEEIFEVEYNEEGVKDQYAWSKSKKGYFIRIPLNCFLLNECTFKTGKKTYTRKFSVIGSQISATKEDISILKDIAVEKQESIVLKNGQTYHLIFPKSDEFDEEIFEVEYNEGAKEQYAWNMNKRGYASPKNTRKRNSLLRIKTSNFVNFQYAEINATGKIIFTHFTIEKAVKR